MKQGGWSVQRGQDWFPRGHPGVGGAGWAAAERGRGEALILPETSSMGGHRNLSKGMSDPLRRREPCLSTRHVKEHF